MVDSRNETSSVLLEHHVFLEYNTHHIAAYVGVDGRSVASRNAAAQGVRGASIAGVGAFRASARRPFGSGGQDRVASKTRRDCAADRGGVEGLSTHKTTAARCGVLRARHGGGGVGDWGAVVVLMVLEVFRQQYRPQAPRIQDLPDIAVSKMVSVSNDRQFFSRWLFLHSSFVLVLVHLSMQKAIFLYSGGVNFVEVQRYLFRIRSKSMNDPQSRYNKRNFPKAIIFISCCRSQERST